MAANRDYEKRQNILQGLQRTKSRLEQLQRDSPNRSPVNMSPVNIGPVDHMYIPSMKSSSPSTSTSYFNRREQQRIALEHAHTQTVSYVLPQDSSYNNFIIPVLPRFNEQGELIQPQLPPK